MPCVLPVLSLKLMSVLKHGGDKTSHIRFSFFMSCLGIVVSFMVLAGIVIALKYAGHSVGWGFQFQEPIFLIILIFILCLFAANEWDMFEIQLPYWLGGKIDNVMQQNDHHSPLGHFITGAFATVMATPCSAPFLGTAITFALSQGSIEILMTFFMMGIGLATPYIFFTLFPQTVNKLPKPGNWMVKAKHFFGFLLLLTAVWLLYVLHNQIGVLSTLSLSISLLVMFTLLNYIKKNGTALITVLAIISTMISGFLLPLKVAQTIAPIAEKQGIWHVFDASIINDLIDDNKIIFVDVTADWCITCKYNKKTVVDTDEIMHILMDKNVIAMKADFTSHDKNIETFLNTYQRYGIPFNIIYGPKAKEGIIQPELLDKEELLESFHQAGYKRNK